MDAFDDPVYGIFDWGSYYRIEMGKNNLYKAYIFTNPIMCALLYGKYLMRMTNKTHDKVTLTIPVFCDSFHNGNILPCVLYNNIICSLGILYKKEIPSHIRDTLCQIHNVEMTCLYYNEKPGLLSNFQGDYNEGSKIFIQQQHEISSVAKNFANNTKIRVNFWNPTCNLFFAFRRNDKFVDIDLKYISLQLNGYDAIVINKPSLVYEECPQFSNVDSSYNTRNLTFKNARRPLFPVEIWATIIKYLTSDDGISLSCSCKSLWNISQYSLIKNTPIRRIEGWYCIPFFSDPITSYQITKSINLNRIDNATLNLRWDDDDKMNLNDDDGDCNDDWCTIHTFITSYNILFSDVGVMYPIYNLS